MSEFDLYCGGCGEPIGKMERSMMIEATKDGKNEAESFGFFHGKSLLALVVAQQARNTRIGHGQAFHQHAQERLAELITAIRRCTSSAPPASSVSVKSVSPSEQRTH